MKRITSLYLLLALGLTAACGTGNEDRLSPGATPASTGPGGSTPPSTAPVTIPEPPRPEDAFVRGNRNSKATALGRLCWIEREVALVTGELLATTFVREGGPAPDEERGAEAMERVKTLVNSLSKEAGSDAGLPEAVRPFRARLEAAAKEAKAALSDVPTRASRAQRQQAFQALTRILDFEHFPAVKEFAAAAEADPDSCPDISFGVDPSQS